MEWITFCSQTGSEIVNISKAINIIPSLFITNNYKKLSTSTLKYIEENKIEVYQLPFNPTKEDYLLLINNLKTLNNPLITLHGFLRIIPKELCDEFEGKIFNGHPGLITEYEELKGKDPQVKVWNSKEKYPFIGSVIHKVTVGVDEGKIISYHKEINKAETLDQLFNDLKEISLKLWVKFFTKSR